MFAAGPYQSTNETIDGLSKWLKTSPIDRFTSQMSMAEYMSFYHRSVISVASDAYSEAVFYTDIINRFCGLALHDCSGIVIIYVSNDL